MPCLMTVVNRSQLTSCLRSRLWTRIALGDWSLRLNCRTFKGYEEVRVPAVRSGAGAAAEEKLVKIEEMEDWAQLAFQGYKWALILHLLLMTAPLICLMSHLACSLWRCKCHKLRDEIKFHLLDTWSESEISLEDNNDKEHNKCVWLWTFTSRLLQWITATSFLVFLTGHWIGYRAKSIRLHPTAMSTCWSVHPLEQAKQTLPWQQSLEKSASLPRPQQAIHTYT